MKNIEKIGKQRLTKTLQIQKIEQQKIKQQGARINLINISQIDFIHHQQHTYFPNLDKHYNNGRKFSIDNWTINKCKTNIKQQREGKNNQTNLINYKNIKKNNNNYNVNKNLQNYLPYEELINSKNQYKKNYKVYQQLYRIHKSYFHFTYPLFYQDIQCTNFNQNFVGKTNIQEYLTRRKKLMSRLKQHKRQKLTSNHFQRPFKNVTTIPIRFPINKSSIKQNVSQIISNIIIHQNKLTH